MSFIVHDMIDHITIYDISEVICIGMTFNVFFCIFLLKMTEATNT